MSARALGLAAMVTAITAVTLASCHTTAPATTAPAPTVRVEHAGELHADLPHPPQP